MSVAEFEALLADIVRRGILTPLAITRDGVVLDGRHRLQIAVELGLETLRFGSLRRMTRSTSCSRPRCNAAS